MVGAERGGTGVKCKDLDDGLVVNIVASLGRLFRIAADGRDPWPPRPYTVECENWWAMTSDVEESLAVHLGVHVHPKIVHAKLRRLHERGLLSGCPCGCRGDWSVTTAWLQLFDVEPVEVVEKYGHVAKWIRDRGNPELLKFVPRQVNYEREVAQA